MKRLIKIELGINEINEIEIEKITQGDINSNFINLIFKNIDINNYKLLCFFKSKNEEKPIVADEIKEISDSVDVAIPNIFLKKAQKIEIEFALKSKLDNSLLTVNKRLELEITPTINGAYLTAIAGEELNLTIEEQIQRIEDLSKNIDVIVKDAAKEVVSGQLQGAIANIEQGIREQGALSVVQIENIRDKTLELLETTKNNKVNEFKTYLEQESANIKSEIETTKNNTLEEITNSATAISSKIVEDVKKVVEEHKNQIVNAVNQAGSDQKTELTQAKDDFIKLLDAKATEIIERGHLQIVEALETFIADKKKELDDYELEKETQLNNFNETQKAELQSETEKGKSAITEHGNIERDRIIKEIGAGTDGEKEKLNTHVTTVNIPALNTHEKEKEEELNIYNTTKKKELDTYIEEKKQSLDTYNTSKKEELDTYVTETSKVTLDTYEKEKEGELDNHKNLKTTEITEHVEIKKLELNNHTADKKKEIDTHITTELEKTTTSKKEELETYTTTKKGDIDAHVVVKNGELDKYEKSKEEEFNGFTTSRVQGFETELDEVLESKKGIITQHTNEQVKKVTDEGTKQLGLIGQATGGLSTRVDTLETNKFDKGEVSVDYNTAKKLEDKIKTLENRPQGDYLEKGGYVGTAQTLKTEIDKKLEINTFNETKTALENDINSKVKQSDYDLNKTQLEEKISKKLEAGTFVGTAQDLKDSIDTKLETTTFNQEKETINSNINKKLGKDENAVSASVLEMARLITLAGAVTGSASFKGNSDVTIQVTLNGIDANKITSGVINVDRLPKSAFDEFLAVENKAARLALTKDRVQNGDTVKETDTGRMYLVINDTKLNTEEGYQEYTTIVDWASITGIPSKFTPETHTHTKEQITNFPQSLKNPHVLTINVNNIKKDDYDGSSTKTINITASDLNVYNKGEIDTKLAEKAPSQHQHPTWYYTKNEIDTKLSSKANSNHIHSEYLSNSGNGTITGNLTVKGTIYADDNITAYSDVRLKKNLIELDSSVINKLKQVKFYNYEMIDDSTHRKRVGVKAQELEKLFPELVFEDESGIKSVDYVGLNTYFSFAMQQQLKGSDE